MKLLKLLVQLSILNRTTKAFNYICYPRCCGSSRTFHMSTALLAMPTVTQLSNDPFMKQVNHASYLITLLGKDDPTVGDLLTAQLAHSDGIRGFFASYLTSDDGTADRKEVPEPLIQAMKNIGDQSDLVKLSIMNVIMPTAMSTMHTDPNLQDTSRTTAKRGVKVLEVLKDHPDTKMHCLSLKKLTTSTINDKDIDFIDKNDQYWFQFMKNYGYEEKQKQDIATVLEPFL